ncbi:MAG: 3-isopropylmalate dehydrogenase [Anaerolineaceae bacterium]|nr:3-isopropylmalate dehydrogenase [Anaerolineaceae bacterium]
MSTRPRSPLRADIAVLPGDGIGPEVMAAAIAVMERVSSADLQLTFHEAAMGGHAIDEFGDPLPESTLKTCEQADAILLGAVGGPKWSDPSAPLRPEQGLLALRQKFDLFANLRPVKAYPSLSAQAPLRSDLLTGVDILFVRELTGGIYFGERHEQETGDSAYDTMFYREAEVLRAAHIAFQAARGRRNLLTSIDKANVLAVSRLWRRSVEKLHDEFRDVQLEHLLVDAAAMHLLTRPADFDVILAGNLFGDILSDEASVLAGSLGMLPSASLSADGYGMYEPVHGSAPDIAGRGIANPIGMILSAAMLLRHSLGCETEATAIENAVDGVLEAGARTADIALGASPISTQEFTEAVIEQLA